MPGQGKEGGVMPDQQPLFDGVEPKPLPPIEAPHEDDGDDEDDEK